jgi:hypothetical protein
LALANGRIFQALNTNMATPEGRIVADLCKLDPSPFPTPQAVVEMIRKAYLNSNMDEQLDSIVQEVRKEITTLSGDRKIVVDQYLSIVEATMFNQA